MNTRMTVLTMLVAAAVIAAPLGTEFTYQGVLSDGGAPASGDFDFRFLLYDAEVGGLQAGSIVYVEDLTVTDGRMTTELDFGSVFDGTALWLEVGVRDGVSTGAYTVLQPRQELTAAPFAQHAQVADSAETATTATTADHATTAGDADTVDGQHGSYYLTWSNFTGIPGDLADGDDDTLGDLTCSSDEIAAWNGSAWNCSSDDDTPYTRTYVVGPVGTTTQNGTVLRAAIGDITPPTSEEEAVLVVVEPGTYDVGAGALSILGWMTVEGAGERLTVITGSVCSSPTRSGTIRFPSSYSGLRHLTVLNTCDTTVGVGIDVAGDDALIEHVEVIVEDGADTNTCVYNTGMNLRMNNVAMRAVNVADNNKGLTNLGDFAELVNISAEVGGGTLSNKAVENIGDAFSLKQSSLSISQSGAQSTAFYCSGGSFLLEDVSADGFSSSVGSRGILSIGANGTLDGVRAKGHVAVEALNFSTGKSITMRDVEILGFTEGIVCNAGSAPLSMEIHDSYIHGTFSFGVLNEPGTPACAIHIKGSYFRGMGTAVSGAVFCIATWDDSTFYTNTCP